MASANRARDAKITPTSDIPAQRPASAGGLTGRLRRRRPTWRVALANPRVYIPLTIIVLLLLIAVFANQLAPRDPFAIDASHRLEGPSSTFFFGTDEFGRDIFSRIIIGTRTSMMIAVVSVMFATIIGVSFGLIGGYFGGIWEFATMRSVDVLLAFPPILLAIAVVAFLGSSAANLIGVIAILYMTRFARITYGSVVQVKNREFIEAARVIGVSDTGILRKYVLPNVLAPIFVQLSLSLGFAILLESGLSFLGLGTQPPNPSWGNMIGAARGLMQQNAWFVFWPSLAISVAILSFNTLGDGLRDSLDPRLRR